MQPHEKIIFALDVDNSLAAHAFAERLSPHVGMFKVGLELFIKAGPSIIREIGAPVMLDLKLHDIPETVTRATRVVADLGVWAPRFLTMHVQQRETMRRAVAVTEGTRTQLLGVTVLTSMEVRDLMDLRQAATDPSSSLVSYQPSDRVLDLALLAVSEKVPGLVCSPQEVRVLRKAFSEALLVVPGIRPSGSSQDDQKRAGTPRQAILDGASYLVVGRPIRDAADPVLAAKAIAEEIGAAQQELALKQQTETD